MRPTRLSNRKRLWPIFATDTGWNQAGSDEYQGANHEISGLIEVIDNAPDMEFVPIFYAMATPGTDHKRLLRTIAGSHDAASGRGGAIGCSLWSRPMVLVSRRGTGYGRTLVIVAETEIGSRGAGHRYAGPHANVSQAMVDATDGLIAYGTNPHVDQKLTGMAAAQLLVRTLREEVSPVQFLVKPPVAISIEQQFTSNQPCLGLYALARELGQRFGLVSVSILLGFLMRMAVKWIGFIAIADRNQSPAAASQAKEAASKLSDFLLDHKQAFNGKNWAYKPR